MKKRILFVDDEPLVLQGIQRMLRPMREEWEMDFAEGGEPAKGCLAGASYDVVITDMMMPGINGAQLLDHVREHSPKTIRLVLSGHAEQELAIQCIGLAHQYLSKPCDAASLKATVARVTNRGFALENEEVMTLVAKLKHLPSIPAIYSRIVRLMNDPESTLEAVGSLIGEDVAMTAKILQLVNSSFFGLARKVSKPAEAASFLGMNTLKALVLATNVFSQFESKMPKGFSVAAISQHSQEVGAAARAIARAEDCPRAVVDESMVAGLLHDVGKLVLASSLPQECERAAAAGGESSLEAERGVFGTTHAEVGGYLLGLWGLPPRVVEAIMFHHAPARSEGEDFSPLTAVHVADCLVAEHTPDPTGRGARLDLAWLARIGLASRLPAWRAAVLETFQNPASLN